MHTELAGTITYSIVVPAYCEAGNIGEFHRRLSAAMEPLDGEWELIIVDDRSIDETFAVVSELAARDPRVRGLRFARNQGSHTAILCGLHHARGECAVVLAADLEDPPELVPQLVAKWREDKAKIVWGVRGRRLAQTRSTLFFAGAFYFILRHVMGMKEMPASGTDCFLADRVVLDALARFPERNLNVIALLLWMGFDQAFMVYDKQPRHHGSSGWTLAKKIKLAIDSVTSFSYVPIRWMSLIGVGVACGGFLYAGLVFVMSLFDRVVPGWSSLMFVVLVLGGMQMMMLGILGEYLWRTLDEGRRRPRYIVEDTAGKAEPADLRGGEG
ncbi:Glycosyltransferase [Paramagnetospirillum magnetotacticum MS-1]|uniref:Glycosyltransferase n=1 Tax=Paramagnetospirillum magnetotacticum MS-1 TaxID=272627 RepID=A0A0C2U8E7_PARME|nr:glycosyltransferase family 2 protein [Paramagnetospirillum magnetotacticum]KIL97777.1 Glycosyltransferase [Paramagnetospirillum magnetotacticum MS-1]